MDERFGAEVRKTVTVLFCDVTGSTSLGEQLDPESLRALMSRFFEEMQVVLERHGGTVEKYIGDAVMAVFGIPFEPSPNRDDGYDITDYYGVDPRLGSLGDFVTLNRVPGRQEQCHRDWLACRRGSSVDRIARSLVGRGESGERAAATAFRRARWESRHPAWVLGCPRSARARRLPTFHGSRSPLRSDRLLLRAENLLAQIVPGDERLRAQTGTTCRRRRHSPSSRSSMPRSIWPLHLVRSSTRRQAV